MKIAVAAILAGLACLSAGGAVAAQSVPWTGTETPGTIIVLSSEHRLVLVKDNGEGLTWPVAVGTPGAQYHGITQVTAKIKNPGWTPTPNMRRHNPRLPHYVAPGPKNPLGTRALYLAGTLVHIHGTNAPTSIGRSVSHGCIRMHNADVEELFEMVDVGAQVVVR